MLSAALEGAGLPPLGAGEGGRYTQGGVGGAPNVGIVILACWSEDVEFIVRFKFGAPSGCV